MKHFQTIGRECPDCGELCGNLKLLAAHIDIVHSDPDEADYMCLCGAAFVCSENLIDHLDDPEHLQELTVLCAMRRVAV